MAEPIAANPPDYRSVAAGSPPQPITPGPIHSGGATPVDLTAMAFGAATNADLATTNTAIAEDHAARAGHAADAARKFTAHEGDAVAQFEDLAPDGDPLVSEQAPLDAMAATMQGVVGALGAALGSVGRLPQGLVQAGQGALSPLMSAAQSLGSGGFGGASLASDVDADPVLTDGFGSAGGGGGPGMGTTPAGDLGPPPVPGTSMPTTPAGSMAATGAAGPAGGASAPAGVGGPMVPMMPGGASATGRGGKDDKSGGKRIAAPGVPNGQPVTGRAMAPPNVPVTKSVATDSGRPGITPLKRVVGKDNSPT